MPILIFLLNALGRQLGMVWPPAYYILDGLCAVLYIRAMPKSWRAVGAANLCIVLIYGFDASVAVLSFIPTSLIHLFPGISATFVVCAWLCFMECRPDRKDRLVTALLLPLVFYNLIDELTGDIGFNPAEYFISFFLLLAAFAAFIRVRFAK